jgi:pimeloyl-ACP methyl ester carboxylesterase
MERLHVEVYEPEQTDPTLPVVVFCHGFGGSARNFRPQVRAFRKQVRFVLYDARGHARSRQVVSSAGGDRYDMAALVADLGWVIDECGARKVVLGGLSMGAATALTYALGHQDRIAGLLIAAYPNAGNELSAWALGFAASIEREGVSRAGDTYVWGDSSRFDARAKSLIRQGFLEHSTTALVGLLRDCLARLTPVEQMAASLSGLRVPTRIVVGGEDDGAVEPSRLLARLIPNSSLSVLDRAGHVVNLERVSEFNEELRKLIF